MPIKALAFYPLQVIIPFLNSIISANHSKANREIRIPLIVSLV